MYKARRSKYFYGRFAGVVRKVTRKYAHVDLYGLEDMPVLDMTEHTELSARMPIEHFDWLRTNKKLVHFYAYFENKNGKKRLIVEPQKFRPMTPKLKAKINKQVEAWMALLDKNT